MTGFANYNIAEQSVLDLVPLAGSRRIMTYLKGQAALISQLLKFDLEQAYA
jgi:hypothetical protein